MRESIVDFIFKHKLFDIAYWCPLNVAVRNLTLALFLGAGGLGARVSSWAVWWRWALWMGLWVSHHRDATPGFLVASVSPVALRAMFEGYTVGLRVCEVFFVCVWVYTSKNRSSSPAFNLFTRAQKHVAIRSCESYKPPSLHLTWKKLPK